MKGRDKLVLVARALSTGPCTQAELLVATDIPKGSISGVLSRGVEETYWAKDNPAHPRSPYSLTAKGRQELLGN